MNSRGNPTAGIGDPYFYEWTVGQKRILEMLNPDSNIRSVILQKDGFTGIDDVVINYNDCTSKCIQVKHTRTGDSLTFNDLIFPDGNEVPLLKQLALAWAKAEADQPNTVVELTTNRRAGPREATKKDNTKLPSLETFWASLKSQISDVTSIDQLKFGEEYADAHKAFNYCLDGLAPNKQLKFLSTFELSCGAPDLSKLEQEVTSIICSTFGVPPHGAVRIFQMLDHALRDWATSRRDSEEIIPETVLSALSRGISSDIGDHEIPPPAPFFPSRVRFLEDFQKKLKEAQHPITFLCGVPGSGKTSLISSLANNVDPVVQIRFHAFKPISPESKLVSADTSLVCTPKALWSDLLNQVRKLLRGRLAKYGVPIINDFLTTDQLRDHFLRLAAAYSKDIGKKVIIGIDGIDHAARAGVDGKHLLDSLLSPERVPPELHILIAGQPPEAYAEYPIWLKSAHSTVLRIDVPLLNVDDITVLCSDTGVSIQGSSPDSVARLIFQKSEGNTLPAVFAAYEAKQCSTFSQLEERLNSSHLTGELGAYYDSIWSKLVASLGEHSLTKQVRIATALCLLSQKILPESFESAYSDLSLRTAHWKEYLLTLYPLVVRDTGGFRVLHNDVRIYLNSKLSGQKDLLRDSAKKLLSFVKTSDDFALSRHADLQNLLKAAGVGEHIVDIATPKYVAEGWEIGRSHAETATILQIALDHAVDTNDWASIHKVVIALTSLSQLVRVTQTSDFNSYRFEHSAETPSETIVLSVEKYVLNPQDWSIEIMSEVLSAVELLWSRNLSPRAKALFVRWFGGFDLASLPKVLTKEELFEHGNSYSNKFRDLLVNIGYWSSILHSRCFTLTGPEDDENTQWIFAAMVGGRCKGAAKQSALRWTRQIGKARYWFQDVFEDILDDLNERKQWTHIRLFFRQFGKAKLNSHLKTKLTAYLIISGENDAASFFDDFIKTWKDLVSVDSVNIKRHEYYFWSAFCKGYIEHTRPVLALAEEIQTSYFAEYQSQDIGERTPFARVVFAAALIGQVLRVYRAGGSLVGYENELKSSLLAVTSLQELRNSHFLHNTNSAVRMLLIAFSFFRTKVSPSYAAACKAAMHSMVKMHPADGRLEPLWLYFIEEGEIQPLEEYYEHFFGESGIAWSQQVHERLSLVEKFKPLARMLGWNAKILETDRVLSQLTIGFDNHKDYVLANPLQWYRELSRTTRKVPDETVFNLLAINQKAEDLGDNRMSSDVETEILLNAAKEGPSQLWKVLTLISQDDGRRWFKLDYIGTFHALIRLTETAAFTREDILGLWSLAIGALSWTNENDQRTLEDFRNALIAATRKLDDPEKLIETMRSLGNTEFEVTGKDYSRNTWWFNRKADEEVEAILEPTKGQEIKKRIDPILDSIAMDRSSKHYRALEYLLDEANREGKCLDKALIEQVFARSLRASYGYSWSSEGLDELVYSLSPHINDDAVFLGFLKDSVATIKERAGDDIRLWIDAVSNNLDDLCRFRSMSLDTQQLENGLSSWITLLDFWARDRTRREINKPIYDLRLIHDPQTWADFAVIYLAFLLNSTMTEQIFAATRGLWALAKTDPKALRLLPELYASFRSDVRMRILGVCERICAQAPEAQKYIEPILADARISDQFGESLQGWIADCSLAKLQGRPRPVWNYSRKEQLYESLKSVPAIITDATKFGSRRLSSGYSAIEVLLKQLSVFVELDVDEFAAKAFSIKAAGTHEESIPLGFGVSRLDRGMRATPNSEIISLYEAAGDLAVVTGSKDYIAEIFATSLLKSDDPFLILETPPFFGSLGPISWPIGEELQKLLEMTTGDVLLQNSFDKVIHAGLPPRFEVLAGYMSSYSDKMDVEFFTAYGPRLDPTKLKSDSMPHSFNGRSYSLGFSRILHPLSNIINDWVAWKAGGLSEYSSVQLMPSSYVAKLLRLSCSQSNPFILVDEHGATILEHQQFTGPIRSELFEPHFRQPKLQRWIIEASALRSLMASRPNLERKGWLEKSDYERPR